VTQVNAIQTAIDAVNDLNGVPEKQKPQLPDAVTARADALVKSDDAPLRVLSLGKGHTFIYVRLTDIIQMAVASEDSPRS
jgi:hypothetical protein